MYYVTINTPNGIKGSKELNELADKLRKKYKNSKNIKIGFDMGFDGVWELVIENTNNDTALVLKPSNRAPKAMEVFVYLTSFSTQPKEDELICVWNKDLLINIPKIISVISKK
jgi:hypothetical protein